MQKAKGGGREAESKKHKAEGRFQNIHYIHIPF
jgi:hypothetical protein